MGNFSGKEIDKIINNMREYSFFYHYNKPASKARGKPVISIHYRNQCILVSNIICEVHTKGRLNKRQPYFVVTGRAKNIEIIDDIAYIK